MTDPLVIVSCSPARRRSLDLAARLSRAGIPSVIAPRCDALPLSGPQFAVGVPQAFARAAALHVSESLEAHGPYRTASEPGDEEELFPTRQRRLAAFFAIGVAFGLGHVYAREYVAGALLALGQLACLVLAARGIPEVLWAFPALMALDAWGALRAVDRENDGARRDPSAQLAVTLPAVALVLAGATAVAPAAAAHERPAVSAPR